MRLLTATTAALLAACAVSGYAGQPVDYGRLYAAIAAVESDSGKTSGNRYQLTELWLADLERIMGCPVNRPHLRTNAKAAEEAMLVYWAYYTSRYVARTGRPVTAEILAKLHRVGYAGLWRKPRTAENYWRRVRKHYGRGN